MGFFVYRHLGLVGCNICLMKRIIKLLILCLLSSGFTYAQDTLSYSKIFGVGGGLGIGLGKETASRFSILFFRKTDVFDFFVHFSRNISSISPNIYKDYSASAPDDWYHSHEGSKYPIFIIGFGPIINYKNMELLPSIGFSYNTSLHRYFDPTETLGYKGYYYVYGDDEKYFPVLGIGLLSRKSKDLSFYGNCHIGKIISISIGVAYEMDVNYF